MPDQLQLRGGTTAQNNAFTGAAREVTVDTTKDTLIVHDATTAGGNPLMREDGANSALINGSVSEPALAFAGDSANTGIYSPGTDQIAVSTNGVERVEWGTSEVVFNDGGADYDFRVEGDTNTALFFVDASTDRVGVGTTSPSAPLEISNSVPIIRLTDSDGTNTYGQISASTATLTFAHRNNASNGQIVFQGLGGGVTDEYARFDTLGRLGIGTSSPSEVLDLRSTGTTRIFFESNDGGSPEYRATVGVDSGGFKIQTRDGTYGSNTDRLTIDTSGRVGIGTTSPGSLLQLTGSGVGANYLVINASSSGSETLEVGVPSGGGNVQLTATHSGGGSNSAGFIFRTRAGSSGTAERVRIDSSGRLLVGTSSSRSVDNEKILQIEGVNQQSSSMSLTRNTNSSAPPNISFGKSRGSTLGSNTIVQSGDSLGVIVFCGADGSDTNSIAAAITGQVDGTPGSNDMPGRLVFSTTPSSGSSPTERLRIDREGNSIFGSAGTLNSSDTVGIIPSEGRITFGMNGRSSLVTGESACYIFSGSGSTGTFPAGNLILQSRSNVSRSIQFATGSTPTVRMTILGSGAVNIAGSLSKGSGSFKIDHPLPEKKETHHLVHSFIEGPQADLIYRGKVELSNGAATVNLDTAARMTEGTFVLLNTNVQCFTSNESDWTAVRGSVSGNILTIAAEDNTSTATVSWLVIGERKDEHMLDTDWTDENGRVITEPLKETELVSEDPEAN